MCRSVKDCVTVFSVTVDLSRFSFRMSRFPPHFRMKQRWWDRKLQQRKWERAKEGREKPLEKLQNWRGLRTYTGARTWADEAAGLAFKPIEAKSLKSWGAPADICFRYSQLIKTEECQNQERGKKQQCVYRRANVFVWSGLMWYPWLCIHH